MARTDPGIRTRRPRLITLFLVAFGGALGGVARYGLSRAIHLRIRGAFPWGTLAVNVSGALVLGILAAVVGNDGPALAALAALVEGGAGRGGTPWAFLTVGVLGSYTTVSTFSFETLDLLRRGPLPEAATYAALSFLLCIGGAALGWWGMTGVLAG